MKLIRNIQEKKLDGIYRKYPLVKDTGEISWPGRFPTEDSIEQLKRTIADDSSFQREYMLQIIASDDQVVRPEWIQYYDTLPENNLANFRYAATGVDPAISEKETADYTAMVSGRIYGRKNNLRIYVLPNPINERMDFPKTVATIKSVSKTLGNGAPSHLWIEGVAYQKALIDHLKSEGWPVKEYKPQGSDKRARLSLVSSLIQSGNVLFPRHGAERLIAQMIGFGTERHDDLSDAFCILVLSVVGQESFTIKGYYSLFSDKQVDDPYAEGLPLLGEKRLGVVLAGGSSDYSTIVLRAENAAQVLYHELTNDVTVVATKVIELAKEHNIPVADKYIFVDKVGMGQELCEKIKQCAVGQFDINKYEYCQNYGIDMNQDTPYEAKRFVNVRARSYWRLMEWLKKSGKLFDRPVFDDLLYIVYADQEGRSKMIDKDRLIEEGIDPSIPEALVLTIVTDKESEDPYVQEEEVLIWPDIGI